MLVPQMRVLESACEPSGGLTRTVAAGTEGEEQ